MSDYLSFLAGAVAVICLVFLLVLAYETGQSSFGAACAEGRTISIDKVEYRCAKQETKR